MKKSRLVLSLALAGSLSLLSACQTISSHNPFRHRAPDYKSAQQENPLEVPPGIDNPPSSEALSIPQAGSGSAMPPVTVNGQLVNESGAGAAAAPPSAVVTGNSLTLADDPAGAYRRVGLALERGGIGTISARDDNAHSYQLAVNTVATTETAPEGGFMHRLFHRHHSETKAVTGTVTVSIAPSGSGSVVNVQGDEDAVERVLGMLQQRLGGS